MSRARRRKPRREKRDPTEGWIPRTRVGRWVQEGRITSVDELFKMSLPIKESEIIDTLLPNLQEEVLDINLVQKQTDAGEKSRFKATVVVGNNDGYVGIGTAKAKEIGPAIRKAILIAKLNIIPIRRSCGSWECACGLGHTVPFKVTGKAGSVQVNLFPAPKGTGLAIGEVGKTMLRLGGIEDVWCKARGNTRTTVNYAYAVYDALRETNKIMTPQDWA
ncbi:MAG: 30S ribosomal protein S5 [Promethearchaeota archaeon]